MSIPTLRIGEGWDVHQLVTGRPLVLGGITIPHSHGLLGHSDADALLHAITDALLGGAALGDIGRHFPDTDPQFKGADSGVLLAEAARTAATGAGLGLAIVDKAMQRLGGQVEVANAPEGGLVVHLRLRHARQARPNQTTTRSEG